METEKKKFPKTVKELLLTFTKQRILFGNAIFLKAFLASYISLSYATFLLFFTVSFMIKWTCWKTVTVISWIHSGNKI